jgi:hypothetical protein
MLSMMPCVFSTTAVARSSVEAVVVDATVVEALALGIHALAGEGFLLLVALCLGCSFLLNLLLHDPRPSRDCPSFVHVLLHELQVLVLLAKAR